MAELTRRAFLQLTAGGGALAAGMGGISSDKLIPYVVPPAEIRPGVWSQFATVCRECPAGCGMHVWHIDGRATKAEGNPVHPIAGGALCPRGQASVQGLYDCDRIRGPMLIQRFGDKVTYAQKPWDVLLGTLAGDLKKSGKVAVVSDLQTGALADVLEKFAAAFGGQALFYEPFNYECQRAAHKAIFGSPVIPHYRLDECEMILSFSADFLESWISNVEFARQFATAHAYGDMMQEPATKNRGQAPLSQTTRNWSQSLRQCRFVYVGPHMTMTAANADEFLRVDPSAVLPLALSILLEVIDRGWSKADLSALKPTLAAAAARQQSPPDVSRQKVVALAEAFVKADGSVALAGEYGTTLAAVTALLNLAAGRMGQTVDFARPHALGKTATNAQLTELISSLGKGDTLVVHNVNLAYLRPDLLHKLNKLDRIVYLGTMPDETSGAWEAVAQSDAAVPDKPPLAPQPGQATPAQTWVPPIDSPLESWGEYEPIIGVHGLMQPTMKRVFDTQPAGDILLRLAELAGKPLRQPGERGNVGGFEAWLGSRWQALHARLGGGKPFADFWHDSLQAGGAWEDIPAQGVKLADNAAAGLGAIFAEKASVPHAPESAVTLWPWASVLHFDGRGANRGWIQETPDPVTSIVWGSWVELNITQAKSLGVWDGDLVDLVAPDGRKLGPVPVRVSDDTAPGVASIAFGQGHTSMGRLANGMGVNVFGLTAGRDPGGGPLAVTIRPLGRRMASIYTSASDKQFGREILRWVGLSEVATSGPDEKYRLPLPEGYEKDHDLYKPHAEESHRWAMVIDLDRCIGCGACAVACYAENNCAVVGAEPVRKGREMAWLKIPSYRAPGDDRRLGFLPLPCQQCDAAPCEPVCPVFASVHMEEGLNGQVYNRCIGTRYCSNNCPYGGPCPPYHSADPVPESPAAHRI